MINAIGIYIGGSRIDDYKIASKQLAEMHKTRVVADGGVLPSLSNLQNFIYDLLKAKGSKETTDILLTADPHVTGYKIGSTETQCFKIYSLNPNTDLIQDNLLYTPLLKKYNGVSYFSNNGVSGNALTTIASSNNNFIGSFTFEIGIKRTYNSQKEQYLIYKNNYRIMIDTSNHISVIYNDGTLRGVYFTEYAIPLNIKINIIIERNQTTGILTLKVSENGTDWLIFQKTSTTGLLLIDSFNLYIFSNSLNSVYNFFGDIYYVRMYEGLAFDKILKINLNPNDFDYINRNSFTSSNTGEIWNISRSLTGYQLNYIDRNLIQTNGIDSFIYNNYILQTPRTDYLYKNTDSKISENGIFLGKNNNLYKQHFGGLAFSFYGYQNDTIKSNIKNVLNKYSNFFFDINRHGTILNNSTVLNNNTILI